MASQPDILIEYINASYIKLRTSESIKHELSDFYTFDLPGAKYMPGGRYSKHSRGNWDGKIRLYNRRDSVLPRGLLSNLTKNFAAKNNYTTTEDADSDECSGCREINRDTLKSFIDGLDLRGTNGDRITCREDQLDAIEAGLRERRTLILSPTASGKTLIGYVIFQYLRTEGLSKSFGRSQALYGKASGFRGLILVPRIQLTEQLVSDWCSFSAGQPDKSKYKLQKEDFQVIYGGNTSGIDKSTTGTSRIVVSTWQSLYKLPAEIFEQFNVVLGDEAHEFRAKSLSHIMNSCINAHDRIGLTGTLDGTNTHKLVLEGLFGQVKKIVSSRELMDRGHIAKLDTIKILLLKHPDSECKALKRGEGTYEEEIKFLISSDARNKFISKLGLSLKGNSLILFQRVETHGQVLFDMMRAMDSKRKVFYIHGGIDTDIRESVRQIVERESEAIILASYGTFSTGINIRNLHNVIFASPSKSRIRNLQSIGRGLRIGDSKESATLFDIADDLRPSGKGSENFTYRHMEERLKIYIEEKFPYKVFRIDLAETGTKVFSNDKK